MVEKLVRDGQVAVLVSPGFGAGWSTWNDDSEQAVFDPDLARIVLGESDEDLEQAARRKYPHAYLGGLRDLTVVWLPEGTPFSINEYDGSESIYRGDRLDYTA